MLALLTLPFFTLVHATPQLNFAFNSQLPPVARWGEEYSYTISEDTFISDDGSSISYSAANLPSWLTLTGRTLQGTLAPGSGVDSATFQLTAEDASGSTTTDCVLQLADTQPPTFSPSALESALASSGPVANANSAVLTPNKPFSIQFPNDFFTSDGRSVVGHYAVTGGHSPLPIWLNFDGAAGVFSGIAPAVNSEIAKAQSFSILYIVSTFSGFESAAAEFNLMLGANVLAMDISTDVVNATVGQSFTYDSPLASISLNGESIQKGNLSASHATIPSDAASWMSFDNSTYTLVGTPPSDSAGNNYTVTIDVVDTYQDAVSWDVLVEVADQNNDTVFKTSSLPAANATRGGWFEYNLGPYLLNEDVTLELDDDTPNWLSINNDNKTISGQVPGDFVSGTVSIDVSISKRDNDGTSQKAHFDIYGSGDIVSSSSIASSTSTMYSSNATSSFASSTATSSNISTSANATSSYNSYNSTTATATPRSTSTSVSATNTGTSTSTSTSTSTTSTSSASASSSAGAIPPISKKNSSNGVAIGCGVGIPVGLIAIAAIVLVFCCRKRRRNKRNNVEAGTGPGDDSAGKDTIISGPTPAGGLAVTPVFRRNSTDNSVYDDAPEYLGDGDDGTICSDEKKEYDSDSDSGSDAGSGIGAGNAEALQRASRLNFMALDNNSQGTLNPASDTEVPPIPEQHEEDEIVDVPRESWRHTNTDARRWQDNRLSNSSLGSVVPPAVPTIQLADNEYKAMPKDTSSNMFVPVSRSSSQYADSHKKSESKVSEQLSEHDLTDDSGCNIEQYVDAEGNVAWRKAEDGGTATLNTVNLDRKPSQGKTPEGKRGEFVFV